MSVRRSVLPSGLRIVTEEVSSVRSAAIGIWVNVGSRDESPATAGASYFLEHLLFKGTARRTALEISSSIVSRWRDECLYLKGIHLLLCTCD